MSEQPIPSDAVRTGQVASTPEGGPVGEGAPAAAPGAGQVQATPEAWPAGDGEEARPPTWREHMRGPILGDESAAPGQGPGPATAAAKAETGGAPYAGRYDSPASSAPGSGSGDAASRAADDDELRKWPPYSGKPVTEVNRDAMKYVAPVVAQAEKLAIGAIDLSAKGLSRLARFLEARRQEREGGDGSR